MARRELITKEAMEKHCKAEILSVVEDSVTDDLESLFEDLRLGKEPNKIAATYFLPKLTKEEMKLVERKETNYLQTFWSQYPDVPEAEMMLSESDSKFVYGTGWRTTFTIKNKSLQNNSNCCNLQ